MNYHNTIMVIKKPIESTLKSLKRAGVSELTPFEIITLTPDSNIAYVKIPNKQLH